jgi:flagellar hook protein FlgE
MSLSGALSSAISGLSAQSQAIAMVSDNLANASTVGYKTTSASFDDLVTTVMGSAQYNSGGVSVSGLANVTQQGLLTTSSTPTNVAIQGDGFFVVTSNPAGGGTTSYTRNGAFSTDSQGYLENDGSYLMGWPTNASGQVTTGGAPVPINTNASTVSGSASTEATLALNLPADAAISTAADPLTFSSSIPVYDSQGAPSSVAVTWTKTAANTWTASFSDSSASPTALTLSGTNPTVTGATSLTVTFNSDGSLASTVPSNPVIAVSGWSSGAAPSNITLNLGTGTDGLTQKSSDLTPPAISVTDISADGTAFGKLSSVSVGKNGLVDATYSNGQTIPIYQIAVATFAAPDQLSAQSDGLYQATIGSGNPTLQASGVGAAGTVMGGELESSATNTNTEFATMMTAQQAYSASAQVVSAVDKMFDTLISSMR